MKQDIGVCKSVSITCISETSWLDGDAWLKNVERAGGRNVDQWSVDWDEGNSGGYSSLIETEGLDGSSRKFLLDSGWNNAYMDAAFEREGIDAMLARREIEFLYVTHEHFDHYFGIASVLRHGPDITNDPNTFHKKAHALKVHVPSFLCRDAFPHTGELVRMPDIVYFYSGLCSVTFDLDVLGVRASIPVFKWDKASSASGDAAIEHRTFAEFARTR